MTAREVVAALRAARVKLWYEHGYRSAYSQCGLAKRLGVSHVSLNTWENGHGVPCNPDIYPRWARAVHMTFEMSVA